MGSGQALGYLKEMNSTPFESQKVMDGDTLDIGGKTLKFIGAPNLHWPDSIYTYLREDRLLFTCDSFGAHYCKDKIFDDELDDYSDSYKYYFDVILRPFSKFMIKAIDKIELLEIDMICPGHGPILRSTWKEKVSMARQYATEFMDQVKPADTCILIAYVSAYGYTGEMAHVIAEGIRSEGYHNIEIVDIEHMQLGELEERIVRASGILIGSPTINKNTLLPVYKLFSVVNPLRDKGKIAGTFGSYGWSGEAVELIDSHLRNLRFDVPQAGLAIRFYPDQNQRAELISFGGRFARELKEKESISAAS
jgi:flavorubredoxin